MNRNIGKGMSLFLTAVLLLAVTLGAGTVRAEGGARPLGPASPYMDDTLPPALTAMKAETQVAPAGLGTSGSGIADAAAWLRTQQDAAAGWFPWTPGTGATVNTQGPTARGLLKAYQQSGVADFKTGAIAAGNYLVPTYPRTYTDGDPRFATHDPLFLEELSVLTADPVYATFVQTYFWDKLTGGTYGEANDLDAGEFGALVVSSRLAQGIVELSPWDLSATAIAAHAAGETAIRDALMGQILAGLDATTVATGYDVIGLAGAVWAAGVTGVNLDPTAGVYSSLNTTAELAAKLATLGAQSDGSWLWSSAASAGDITNHDVQTTAFAILALDSVNHPAYAGQIARGAAFIRSLQETSGQFLSWPTASPAAQGGVEVHAEALSALVTVAPSVAYVDDSWAGTTAGVDPDAGGPAIAFGYDAFATIREGIDAVNGSTVNVAAGTYAESIDVNVDNLTLLGPNTGIDPNGATPRNTEAVIQPTAWYGIYVEAQNVTIDGFTIDGQATTDYGIYAYTGTGEGGLLLTNNIVKNIVTYGFLGWVQSGAPSSDNLISKNLFESIPGRSIVALWNYYADVVNNVVQHTAVGIYAENANQPESTGAVEWKQNKISATRAGIWYNLVYGTATPLTISDNIINVENNSTGTRWDGIWLTSLGGSVNPTISGNVITGASVTQLTIGYHMWNNTTTATDGIVVQGGTVTDVDYGVWINNWDGYPTVGGSNAGRSNAKMNQVTIDGAELAGVYLKDNPLNTSGASASVYANIQNSTIKNSGIGILVDGEDASVKANLNGIFGNTQGMVNNNAATTMDAQNNWWGTACNPAPLMSGLVDFTPWWGDPTGSFSLSANATTINPGDSAAQQMAVINCAAPGTTITYPTGTYPGGIIVTANGVTINLNGATVGHGTPAYTIDADDVTLLNGILDGTGDPASPGVLVLDGADNFILQNTEIKNWADGVEVAGAHESLKLVDNWIHNNTDAGLQVNTLAALSGIVTVEGNLFKANGVGISSAVALDAEYNSWGTKAAPAAMANVDADPWTFSEIYFDVDPLTANDQYVRHVNETNLFDVTLMADAENLNGLSFKFTYDAVKLTLNTKTLQGVWDGACEELLPQPPGAVAYRCTLTSGPEWDGGAIATFNFTANAGPTGNGPWTALFDVAHAVADTSSAAVGGVKVFVNNAGFDAPSTADRDIAETPADDGQIIIDGLANYTGFVDLQGRANDSGALFEVHNQALKSGATVYANGTTASSGKYTTAYASTWQLVIGQTYWFQVDRALYLPTTAVASYISSVIPTDWQHSKVLATRPLESVATVMLLGGDATNDNVIEVSDATCIGGRYGQAPAACGSGGTSDVNEDGKMDILDLTLMGGNYGKTASPAPAAWTP